MNRKELQQLARERLRDTRALLAARRWSAAYYLAGYAVECALKACIIVRLKQSDDFPDRRFSEQCWTHNLVQLVALAGLKPDFDAALADDPDLLFHWGIVKDWEESSRYTRKTKKQARDLYKAIADSKQGVFSWTKSYW